MEQVYVKARAKINLNLEVLNKREDNYHNLKSVFQKINLYDEIYIKKSNNNSCEIQTNIEELNNKENIIYKAYLKLKELFPEITGVSVKINKKIPMQAGLAGGSTDCASFILGINKLFELNLSKKEIENIGKCLGADVVPCLYNRAVIAEGIGDIITKVNTDFKYYLVLVKPDMSCNTKEMYDRIDNNKVFNRLDNTDTIVEGLENNNLELITNNLHNAFEEVLDNKTIIEEIKSEFKNNEAMVSQLTGSGSCVYVIFKNKQDAYFAYNNLKNKFETYICTSYNSKREV